MHECWYPLTGMPDDQCRMKVPRERITWFSLPCDVTSRWHGYQLWQLASMSLLEINEIVQIHTDLETPGDDATLSLKRFGRSKMKTDY